MAQTGEINVTAVLDRERFGGYRTLVVVLCGLVAMLDGFDTQAIAFVAPAISRQWGMEVSAFGPIFGAGLFGLMIGALIFGPVADRYGRRVVVIVSTVIFGGFALLTVTADSFGWLLLLRFLTGLGLGGAMPNVIAITSEYSPSRLRTTMITVMFCGFPLGAVLGGIIGSRMIPALGWQSIFYLGGILPFVLLPFLIAVLPESIRYLVSHGAQPAAVARVLNRISPLGGYSANQSFVMPEPALPGFTVGHLFKDGRAPTTLLLWVTFFMNLLMLYFLINWLPSVLRENGVPVEHAIISIALLNLGGIIGGILLARGIDKIGPYGLLIVTYIGAAVLTALIGMTGWSFSLLMLVVFLAGFCVIGAQFAINAVAANAYPTAIRSTGVGWALGIGRIGSIVGPVVGGFLIAAQIGVRELFWISAIPALIAAAAILTLARQKKAADQPAVGADVLVPSKSA
jgi:AAHS family 4-hydroxybenzoate transporter-like MFS transporter